MRQIALDSYDILDSLEEQDYDLMIELAANICNCPIATVTFVDKDRQWFKASKNMPNKQGSREDSFCAHAILHEEVMIVHDAHTDSRFADNPDVIGGLKIGFYAGAPIISPEGYHLGTVCVIDNKPKLEFSEYQKAALKGISTQVTRLLELRMKNKIIQQQTEELLRQEKNLARINMVNREKENDHIAWQLHENIAQILAASKIKVESMVLAKSFNPDMLADLRSYLIMMIDDVKGLSHSITPTTFKSADYTEFINNMIEKFGRENKMNVSMKRESSVLKLNATLGLTIFRIVEYQLQYAKLINADLAAFEFTNNPDSFLTFHHNGKTPASLPDEAETLLKNIGTRADIIHATFVNNEQEGFMELSLN